MQWLELTIHTTSEAIEHLASQLTVWGFDSFMIDDQEEFHAFLEENRQYWDYVDEELETQMQGRSQIRLYIEQDAAAADTVCALRERLQSWKQSLKHLDPGTLQVSTAEVCDEDWENSWKQYYQPIPVGQRLLVVPQWMQPENPENRIPVLLDPGMIFGTGAHASTQMCMKALEEKIHGGERVADLGSGSGILSITALLLGADTALGVDIDPMAEDIARENAAINGLGSDRFRAVTCDVIQNKTQMREIAEGGYDVVLANIVADVIIALAPVVPNFLRPEACFICSGILDVRLDEVLAALKVAGLRVEAVNKMEDWCQITAYLC